MNFNVSYPLGCEIDHTVNYSLVSDNIQKLSEAYNPRESRNSACWSTSKAQGSYPSEWPYWLRSSWRRNCTFIKHYASWIPVPLYMIGDWFYLAWDVLQEVTGIYTNNFDLSLNTKNGFPVFATVVEANYVTKKQDLFSAYKLTQEDKTQIEELSKDPRIVERVSWIYILLINPLNCFKVHPC